MREKDGWIYRSNPHGLGDNRKLCTIEVRGMVWVGIRVWTAERKRWESNGGEPCPNENVLAWQDLPEPARGFWDHGKFYLPPCSANDAKGEL